MAEGWGCGPLEVLYLNGRPVYSRVTLEVMSRLKASLLLLLAGVVLGVAGYHWVLTRHLLESPAPVLEVFFSPNGGSRDRILKATNLCKQSTDLAIYQLTAGPLAQALVDLKNRGKAVRVVADLVSASGQRSELCFLKTNGVNVRLARGGKGGIMHHKFAVVDQKLVITGSYNWSEGAEISNSENLVVLPGTDTASKFSEEFERLWKRAKPLYVWEDDRRQTKCGTVMKVIPPSGNSTEWSFIVNAGGIKKETYQKVPAGLREAMDAPVVAEE